MIYSTIQLIRVKMGPHDAWYVFVVCHVWMRLKRFVESDTYSLLWCVNLPPNWWTRCDEWTNDTSTRIRHIFSYTCCVNHDTWRITNTNHASCEPSFRITPKLPNDCLHFVAHIHHHYEQNNFFLLFYFYFNSILSSDAAVLLAAPFWPIFGHIPRH